MFLFSVSLQNLHSSLDSSGYLPSAGRNTSLQLINGKQKRKHCCRVSALNSTCQSDSYEPSVLLDLTTDLLFISTPQHNTPSVDYTCKNKEANVNLSVNTGNRGKQLAWICLKLNRIRLLSLLGAVS